MLDWVGPFSYAKFQKRPESEVLYCAVTKGKKPKVIYFGLTRQRIATRHKNHHVLKELKGKVEIYSIWFSHPNPRKPKKADLQLVEKILIYYWNKPDLINKSGLKSPPKHSAMLLSRWFDKDWKPQRKPKELKGMPDVLGWQKKGVWSSADLRTWKND